MAYCEMIVDLNGVERNWRIMQQLTSMSRCAAVLKADAYGLGIEPVARTLSSLGCDHFFVSSLEEGLTLRKLLPLAEIFCLHGLSSGTAPAFSKAQLIPVISSIGMAEYWLSSVDTRDRPAALMFDTGISRLALSARAIDDMHASGILGALHIRLVMSHLASADNRHALGNSTQLHRFRDILSNFPGIPASLSNSSGAFLGKEYHFDLVRTGSALFGDNPFTDGQNPMHPVVSIISEIVHVYECEEDGALGYGGTYPVKRGTRIACIPVGYASGYKRNMGNCAVAAIGHTVVPVAGTVSMDLTALDVTHVDPTLAREGARVHLLGGPISFDALGWLANTNCFELTTSLGHSLQRRYIGQAS